MAELEEGAGRGSSVGGPVLAVGAFAAGAAVTLLAKRLIDARRNSGGGAVADQLDVGDGESKEDIATVLRRAALDVAVAASGQAAQRLGSRDQESETEAAASSSG